MKPDSGNFSNKTYREGFLNNDSVVIGNVYRYFRDPILRFLISRGADRETAADIFCETFLAVQHNILKERFQDDGVPFFFYFQKISHLIWLKQVRDQKKSIPIEGTNHPDPVEESEIFEDEDQALFQSMIFSNLNRMKPDCQRIIKATVIENKKLQTAATELGIKYEILKKNKSKCLEKLRKMIKNDHRFRFFGSELPRWFKN